MTGPGTLTYAWKVSSESCCDKLEFILDGASQANIGGEVAWQGKTNAIPTGTHVLKWRYSKDGSVANGSDAGWVDRIAYVPTTLKVGSSLFSVARIWGFGQFQGYDDTGKSV